ncbi:MAG: rod shape-determining protein MreD [Firmicutes bacterium]|nr:rod shape-determining protein MreD [Bacillota bacterium]
MRYLKAGAAFLVAFLLQGSLLNMFSIAGHTPNLLLALVMMMSFLYEKQMIGILYGALFGLLYDVCYCDVIGPTAIAFVITAACIMSMRYYANVENIISMSVVSIIAFLIYYGVHWGLMSIAGSPVGLGHILLGSIVTMIYTLIVNIVIYKVLIKNVVKHHKDRYFI